jgi:hypothetical protein
MTASDTRLHEDLARELRALRRIDGGFPLARGGSSEVEPTALAALALGDVEAKGWLEDVATAGGAIAATVPSGGPTIGALAALAVCPGEIAGRLLGAAVSARALPLPTDTEPHGRQGWGWTSDTRSLVEPTCRILIATKALNPGDRNTRAEALRILADRQCAEGGWNFGNASVFDVDLRAYAQTTAMALIALQDEDPALTEPGIGFLRGRWRAEAGGLTIAQTILAFRLHGVTQELGPLLGALDDVRRRRSFLGRTLTLAWATLATGPDALLEPLRPRA